ICEAAGRPGQRFVPVRSVENQAALMRHRARELMVGQRTAALNALRGHLSEIGVVAAQGVQNVYVLKELIDGGVDENGEFVVPDCVRLALAPLVRQIDALDEAIEAIDRELEASVLGHRKGHNDALRRWASGMLERKTVKYKFKLTAVALANKLARIVYALATKGGHYDDRPVAA